MPKILIAFLLLASPVPTMAEDLSGAAHVIDGDTFTVDERKVRLYGIDAPEMSQTCDRNGEAWACGQTAAEQLASMIGSAVVNCSGDEIDQYGRLVAVCWSNGVELNAAMVATGWAVAFRQYSMAYIGQENRAKSERQGIWSSTFDLPGTYRLAQRSREERETAPRAPRSQRAPAAFQGGCVIKGNRNRRGQWIYHLPGMPYYDQTRPEEIFCSEADAQAAGYRRAIVR